jgi:hypothetical protein
VTLKELKALTKYLKAERVTYYRDGDFELRLGGAEEAVSTAKTVPLDAPTPATEPIPHHIQHLQSLRKLSDIELLDELIPDLRADDAV